MTDLFFVVLVLACYAILYVAAVRGRDMLFIMLAFMCTMAFLFATKIVRVAGLPLVPSAPFLAVTFYSGTIAQEFFGQREARKILFINLGVMLGFTGLGLLVRHMEIYVPQDAAILSVGQAYDTLLDFFPRALLAALVAFSCAYALNILLTRALHRLAGERFFALRSFTSVALSNLLDISAFVTLAYPWNAETSATILTTWGVRLVCICAGIPVVWAIKRHYQRAGRVEHGIA